MIMWAAVLGVLILDSRTVISGAAGAVQLCIQTVIPSLFPFFVISSILTSALSGISSPLLRPIGRLCRIPAGSEPLLLIGFLGGYPVGAQCVYEAWQTGSLREDDAKRMLGFCNHAGPSFIFGMTAALFASRAAPWCLWIIQIISALVVAVLLPGTPQFCGHQRSRAPLTLSKALERAMGSMKSVCGWVIAFRVVIAVGEKWFLGSLPTEARILLTGILELANGCCAMTDVPLESVRFLLCAVCLSFGGLCVGMQTASAVKELGSGQYFPGKVIQTLTAFLLAQLCLPFLYPGESTANAPILCALCAGILLAVGLFLKFRKNTSRNPSPSVV